MIRNLAYIGFRSPNAEEWRNFGPEILGAELADDGPDGAVRLRVDDAAWRIAIHPGDVDDLAYLGWEVDDIDATIASVEAAGIAVEDGVFTDPFGFRHELVTGVEQGKPFTPGRQLSGFVTGEQGLGHAVLIVPDLAAAEAFYTDVLGFKPSDSIESGLSLRFFHCAGNAARHHTVAMASVPGMVGMHHLMLEVNSLDDVGSALDLINEHQIPLAMSLGRHTNDLMTSFYVRTPSGFEIEYGTGGLTVDDDTWEVGLHDAQSIWGHKPPATGPLFPSILRPVAS
jgi:3,4-dihydroxy-9,10-secoandrosta-1,3,5(10)-triene-9,17-dione 4,5-dioxygenase